MQAIIYENESGNSFVKEALSGSPQLRIIECSSEEAIRGELDSSDNAVVVIGPSISLGDAAEIAARLTRSHRQTALLLVTAELTKEVLQIAVRAGFRDAVESDLTEIAAAVKRLTDVLLDSTVEQTSTPDKNAGIIAFFGTKGGVGKTVFAVNTAVGLARRDQAQVTLLDLDHQFGDVGVMLGLRPERTVSDLIPAIDRVDAEMLRGFLVPHESGLSALLAPVLSEGYIRPGQSDIQRLLAAARGTADFVIVDTPASFGEDTLAVLDICDCICLVTTLDVPSVKNSQIALQSLKLLNYPEAKIKIVLNRADSKVSLLPAEVERQLKHQIAVQVPSSLEIPRSVNEGRPVLMTDSRSAAAAALGKIADLARTVARKTDIHGVKRPVSLG